MKDEQPLCTALGSIRTGALLDPLNAPDSLLNLSATLPEVFGTLDPACLGRIAERIGAGPGEQELSEVLLLSDTRLHVIQPLLLRPDLALLAESDATGSIGLVLSQVRAKAEGLEVET